MKVRGLKVQEQGARRGHRAEPHHSCPPLPERIRSAGKESLWSPLFILLLLGLQVVSLTKAKRRWPRSCDMVGLQVERV